MITEAVIEPLAQSAAYDKLSSGSRIPANMHTSSSRQKGSGVIGVDAKGASRGPQEPAALVKRLRMYRDELADQGPGIAQSHALGCEIAANTIERMYEALNTIASLETLDRLQAETMRLIAREALGRE